MINGVRLKVCGLTSVKDAEFAERSGADYLGFILYPKSPRYLPLTQFARMAADLPKGKRVAVLVKPTVLELDGALAAGFEYFQIHFGYDTPTAAIAAWARTVGVDRLWLAPKLPPEMDVPEKFLPLAPFFLLDTYQPDGFGGSGRTSDWPKFARHQLAHPDNTWILSGGLKPQNIAAALRHSGARFVDVNSGIESAPGVKDHVKLAAFVASLARAQTI